MKEIAKPEEVYKSSSSKLQAFSFNNVPGQERYSAAKNSKAVLERNGSEGVKSEGKRDKREGSRGIKNRYWHLREEDLVQVKCATIKDFSKTCNFSDIYHYYTCRELGPNKAALRRFPCNCEACNEIITKPWVYGVKAEKQERFADPEDCYFKPLLEDYNQWHFVELNTKGEDEEGVDKEREIVPRHVTTSLSASVEIYNIGALAFQKDKKSEEETEEEYYLVEYIGRPYTSQDESTNPDESDLKVDCYWLNSIPGARYWYTKSKNPVTVDMAYVVATDVEMKPISPTNMIKNRSIRREATRKNALRITDESHDFIVHEIDLRERLEYDPSRVLVDNEASDEEEETEK